MENKRRIPITERFQIKIEPVNSEQTRIWVTDLVKKNRDPDHEILLSVGVKHVGSKFDTQEIDASREIASSGLQSGVKAMIDEGYTYEEVVNLLTQGLTNIDFTEVRRLYKRRKRVS